MRICIRDSVENKIEQIVDSSELQVVSIHSIPSEIEGIEEDEELNDFINNDCKDCLHFKTNNTSESIVMLSDIVIFYKSNKDLDRQLEQLAITGHLDSSNSAGVLLVYKMDYEINSATTMVY